MAKERTRRVAICLITNKYDDVLMGIRNDTSKWTCPGGHLEKNEDPYVGAARELKEETGLDPLDIRLVKVFKNSRNMMLYLFKIQVSPLQKIDVSGDPDAECGNWVYVDPVSIIEELHIPIEENIALKYWAGL